MRLMDAPEWKECVFSLCLYHSNSRCLLENMGINELGMCDACVIVSLDGDLIKNAKKKQLDALIQRNTGSGIE